MQKPSKYNLLSTLNDVNRAQVRDQLALQKVALKRVLKELTLLLRSENPVNLTVLKELTLVLQSEKPVNLIPLHPSTLQTRRQIFIINSKFSLTASRRWILTGLPVGFLLSLVCWETAGLFSSSLEEQDYRQQPTGSSFPWR